MDYNHEFGSVDLILKSEFETKGIDAFCLSLIKVEKQLRRIFTYFIFQHENFTTVSTIYELSDTLSSNTNMYFENFIKGIDKVYPKSIKAIYGDSYDLDLAHLIEITKDRNKIFHGQITSKKLNREDLIARVEIMKNWSKTIADKFSQEIGYDGFGRNSYRKSKLKIKLNNSDEFSNVENYKTFLNTIDRKAKLS